MANRNTRDVTPDDFDPIDLAEVPEYAPLADAETEAFPAAQPEEALEPVTLGGSTAVHTEIAHTETAAIDREPQYIAPADPVYDEVVVATEPVAEAEPAPVAAPRGTIDLGLLLLRLCFGGYLILAALSTFFRLGDAEGISGLETAFGAYPFGGGLAIMVPTLQLAAGVFLLLGLITPVAAAVAVAVTGFMALHEVVASSLGWNALYWDATIWLPVILFVLALVLQFTGPGLYGVDAGRSWARRPLASSWVWLLIGVAAAGLMWWFGTEINPFASV